jgi:hypothetical protein
MMDFASSIKLRGDGFDGNLTSYSSAEATPYISIPSERAKSFTSSDVDCKIMFFHSSVKTVYKPVITP